MSDSETPSGLASSAEMALRRVAAGRIATSRIIVEVELLSLLESARTDEIDPDELVDVASRVAALEEPWTAALELLRDDRGDRGRIESTTALGESYDEDVGPRDSVAVVGEACKMIEACLGDLARALGVPDDYTGRVPSSD